MNEYDNFGRLYRPGLQCFGTYPSEGRSKLACENRDYTTDAKPQTEVYLHSKPKNSSHGLHTEPRFRCVPIMNGTRFAMNLLMMNNYSVISFPALLRYIL